MDVTRRFWDVVLVELWAEWESVLPMPAVPTGLALSRRPSLGRSVDSWD